MGRPKSPIWNHVWEIEDGFKCKYCRRPYKSGATRIRQHLLGNSTNIVKCRRVPPRVQEELTCKYKGHDQYP